VPSSIKFESHVCKELIGNVLSVKNKKSFLATLADAVKRSISPDTTLNVDRALQIADRVVNVYKCAEKTFGSKVCL
jgi:hypothetical protein